MMEVMEMMMEKTLTREKIESLMQWIILRKEGKFSGPQRIQN